MSPTRCSLIVHGSAAPPPGAVEALARSLDGLGACTLDVQTRWTPHGPGDLVAALDTLIRASDADHLLVVAMSRDGCCLPCRAIAEALVARGGLVMAQRHGDAAHRCGPIDATTFLDRLAAAGTDTSPAWWSAVPCEAWAVERRAYIRAKGLDTSLGPIGEVEDLARRALDAAIAVEFVDIDAPIVDPYDLTPPVTSYLGIRNAIVSAALHGDEAERGRRTALVTARAIATAWRAGGVDPTTLQFGGSWARQRALDRWLATPGLREGDALWPRDVDGAMRPLLAIDDALGRIVARAGEVPRAPVSPLDSPPAAAGCARGAPASATTADTSAGTGGDGSPQPRVSVIVVSWNGRDHLGPLFTSLRASDYPRDRLELICVDNGSADGSRDLLAHQFPEVRVVALPENRGFTGGNVAGVEAASGDVFVFLNNDMRVEPDTIRHLVEGLDDEHGCTAACVLSWDGRRLDFLRGSASWEGRGFQEHYGDPRETLPAIDTDATFFPNGGAFAITRDLYTRAGGFDPAFFAYYDDLDLGWGIRVAGGHIRVVREAIVYHRHGATSEAQPRGQKKFLLERNALWTLVKRYGDDALARALAPALLLAVRRFVHDAAFAVAPGEASVPRVIRLTRAPLEQFAAIGEAVRGLPGMVEARRRLAAHRRAPDHVVVSRMGRTLDALSSRTEYQAAQDRLLTLFGLDRVLRARSRILLLTHEPLRSSLSGPGVRVLELGRALARHGASVTVASPLETDLREPALTVARHAGTDDSVSELAAMHDVVIVQGFALESFPSLKAMPIAIVADLYCPFTIEHLEMRTAQLALAPDAREGARFASEAAGALTAQTRQLVIGDFFICASERQRDFWLGALHTAGRLSLPTYGDDPSLRSLIDVVAFGLPDTPPPQKRRAVMKGVLPGIRATDKVLLWAGSILDWQDPQLLIRAVGRLSRTRDDVKLVFMGTRHPNPDVAPMRAVPECRALADALGLSGRHVYFNDWVPYAERHEWLLEADLGVSTHRDHLETHFSFRTRMLDYLWTGLPIVCTRGDVFADLVDAHGLGITVAPGDEAALADAIARMLDEPARHAACATNVRAAATTMTWDQVAAPLLRFCANPRQAADRRPATESFHRRLRHQFRITRWLKRVALRAGVSDARIDQLKQTALVRQLMVVRNRRAYARARRG